MDTEGDHQQFSLLSYRHQELTSGASLSQRQVGHRSATLIICDQLKKLQRTSNYATKLIHVSEKGGIRGKKGWKDIMNGRERKVEGLLRSLGGRKEKGEERRLRDVSHIQSKVTLAPSLLPMPPVQPVLRESSSVLSFHSKPPFYPSTSTRRSDSLDFKSDPPYKQSSNSSFSPIQSFLPEILTKSIDNLASVRRVYLQTKPVAGRKPPTQDFASNV